MDALIDVVLNQKNGSDEKEKFPAVLVNNDNRNEKIGEPIEFEGHTKFTFPGRNKKYSEFVWNWQCFSGVDANDENGYRIYKILNEYGDDWSDAPDDENGNYDYLLGADIEFRNPHVRDEIKAWAKWYFELTGFHGVRMDAVKHISTTFMNEFLDYLKTFNETNFAMGEFWTPDVDKLSNYVEQTGGRMQLLDAPLHYKFYEAGQKGKDFDLRELLNDTLVERNPFYSITFVDNHDTQPLQALESPVEEWFKPMAYAYIMLRENGIPCISYFAMYGATYEAHDKEGNLQKIELKPVEYLEQFLMMRKNVAYGLQRDYFDHNNTVGWTREGTDEHPHALAVIITNSDEGFKEMEVGVKHAGKIFYDALGNRPDKVTIDENGKAFFTANAGSVSVYIPEGCPIC